MTDKQKQAMQKYLSSPKGIAARQRAVRRYNNSAKAKRSRGRYFNSLKGQETKRQYEYRKTILTS